MTIHSLVGVRAIGVLCFGTALTSERYNAAVELS